MKKFLLSFSLVMSCSLFAFASGSEKTSANQNVPTPAPAAQEVAYHCVGYTTSCGGNYQLCCDGCSAWDFVYAAWILDDILCAPQAF